MDEPEIQEEIRNPDGTFKKGVSGNPAGRPKGKTIKERIQEYLDENPESMEMFVKHFVENNRELAWQMLEGRPTQQSDLTSGGNPLTISFDPAFNATSPETEGDSTLTGSLQNS